MSEKHSQTSNQTTNQENMVGLIKQYEISLSDFKYYCKTVEGKYIPPFDSVQIDFIDAMSEMEKLNEGDYIQFTNKKTDEAILFRKKNGNVWFIEHPIFDSNEKWKVSFTSCIDNKMISDFLKLFFEEKQWFKILTWNVKKK